MLNENDLCLVWLDSFMQLSYKKKQALLLMVEEPKDLRKNFETMKDELVPVLSASLFNIMLSSIKQNTLRSVLDDIDQKDIKVVTMTGTDYPERLKQIGDPPLVLYCKGDTRLLKSRCFAVVGTRYITNYGKIVTEKFSKDLCDAGFTIVSGLAPGVDSIAHQTTLERKGKTIAVFAGAYDNIYPASNHDLALDIEMNGLLIWEFQPGLALRNFHFPVRNRIIAGLSEGVLITEAGAKSGALYTKNYAIENNIDVFAVPGNITSSASMGTNRAIACSHAIPVVDITDILNVYNMQLKINIPTVSTLSGDENTIIHMLKSGEKSFQEMIDICKFDAKSLNTLLTTMSIRGLIKKLAGNLYTI
ncbi:MAG: DNA-processing protein DprA [Christensenellaceae bacterium]|jgi:DNA processing protein|nr:DNA-processing protein DprA [Christensenellaceae bacterium]